MDIFFYTVVAGMAVTYVSELIGSTVERLFDPRLLKRIISLPLSVGATWLIGLHGIRLAVVAPAAGFFSLAIMIILNRPVHVQQVVQRRLP
jgi:hypothetical protein